MNKKILFFILTMFLISVASSGFAQGLPRSELFKVEILFSDISDTIKIQHKPINRVSINMRKLIAIGDIEVGVNQNLKAQNGVYIEYYTDQNSSTQTVSAVYYKTSDIKYEFNTNPIIDEAGAINEIHYRIIAVSESGTKGYYPEDESYIKAELKPAVSGNINSSGGELVLQSGNQLEGDTSLSFNSGALATEVTFTAKELTPQETLPVQSQIGTPKITYQLIPTHYGSISPMFMPEVKLYYGNLVQNFRNIEVKWFDELNSNWVNISNFGNDNNKKVISIKLSNLNTGGKLGYFAITEKAVLKTAGYRPAERVFMPGEKIVFRNLEPGDSVTIYNLKGKEIIKLQSTFEWDGRDSGGNLVESGSYIYQIKVNDDIISGSLAFIR